MKVRGIEINILVFRNYSYPMKHNWKKQWSRSMAR